jgi:hypothetical protein
MVKNLEKPGEVNVFFAEKTAGRIGKLGILAAFRSGFQQQMGI